MKLGIEKVEGATGYLQHDLEGLESYLLRQFLSYLSLTT